jgi:hypothetical protein
MQRSQSNVAGPGRLVKISLSVKNGAEVDSRRQRLLARIVLESIWPEHEEMLAIWSDTLFVVVRLPPVSRDNIHPEAVDHHQLNGDLKLMATYISESELEAIRLSYQRPSQSSQSSNSGMTPKDPTSRDSEQIPFFESPSPHPPVPSGSENTSCNRVKISHNQPDVVTPPNARKSSDPRGANSGKPSNPPNKILHICNVDHDFQTGQELANFLTVYGPLKELIYLTNQGKVFVHFHRLEDATRAMEDINRYEKPSRSFIRANFSHLTKLSFDFKAEHRNSRAFNHILREPNIPQRSPGPQHLLSRIVEVTLGEPGTQIQEPALIQFSQVLVARAFGWLGEKPEISFFGTPRRVALTMTTELAAIKVVSKLHGLTLNGVPCFASFRNV